jgi:osmotically-inducible protein OsmY
MNSQSMNSQSRQSGMSGQNGNMSSQQMQQQVKRALTQHGVTATGVNVSINNGTARLTGTVYTQQDISKAKKAAMGVNGVRNVDVSGLRARQNSSGRGNQMNQGNQGNQMNQGNPASMSSSGR